MIVVSDTGPLRYLVEVGAVGVLPRLYGQVLTTPEVISELRLPHFPGVVRRWIEYPPAWLKIDSPGTIQFLDRLDVGEATAISLACERSARLVLVDERDGTELARDLGFATFGTLGVLAQAAAHGEIDFEEAITRLTTKTKFSHTLAVIERTRQRYHELCRDLKRQPGRGDVPR